ncbi:uncharacterized protein BX664DRAFT_351266 [Halteromyces radiatus]|uniref:uncharacterized protein n=1 Tax=Halteromyces radiatus TaxID=101107 RepID=UPI00221F98C6|nr:uncharacterized protein BX664DRAFT_351266 [Halteromyces radiatus]KAI8084462.1 hypothetical protein BX664DRAFT_351266 [Halteromyces radiatus]
MSLTLFRIVFLVVILLSVSFADETHPHIVIHGGKDSGANNTTPSAGKQSISGDIRPMILFSHDDSDDNDGIGRTLDDDSDEHHWGHGNYNRIYKEMSEAKYGSFNDDCSESSFPYDDNLYWNRYDHKGYNGRMKRRIIFIDGCTGKPFPGQQIELQENDQIRQSKKT